MKYIVLVDVEKQPDTITDHYYVTPRTEPLGLLYLESFLKAHGVPVHVCKIPLTLRDWDQVERADIVGLSGLTYCWSSMRTLAARIRNRNPRAVTIAGREHASLASHTVLTDPNFDAVVVGEGEYPLLSLAQGNDFKSTKSLVYRDSSGRCVVNPQHPRIGYRDLYPLERRTEWMDNMLHETSSLFPKMAGIMLSRGCVFKCEFCTAEKMWNGYRNLGIAHAINEVQRSIEKYNVRYFAFHDLMLNVNARILTQFCKEVIRNRIEANFFAMMSATAHNLDFELLRKAGFIEIGVGIEVPSDKRINIGKRLSFKKTVEFIKSISEAGIFVRGYLIIGWPEEESKEELVENYSSALRLLPINGLRISYLTPFPGTLVYQKYKDYCIFRPPEKGFDHFTTMEPILEFKLRADELIEARTRILEKYYCSKSYSSLYNGQRNLKHLKEMNDAFCERISETTLARKQD